MKTRILVVDDQETNRLMLRRRLERRGFEVAEAPDGETGVAKFRADPPHFVIMDIAMPQMSGLEAFQHIREVVQMVVDELREDGIAIPEGPQGDADVYQDTRVAVTV